MTCEILFIGTHFETSMQLKHSATEKVAVKKLLTAATLLVFILHCSVQIGILLHVNMFSLGVTLQVGKSSTLEESQRRGTKREAWVRTGQQRYVVLSLQVKRLLNYE